MSIEVNFHVTIARLILLSFFSLSLPNTIHLSRTRTHPLRCGYIIIIITHTHTHTHTKGILDDVDYTHYIREEKMMPAKSKKKKYKKIIYYLKHLAGAVAMTRFSPVSCYFRTMRRNGATTTAVHHQRNKNKKKMRIRKWKCSTLVAL